MREHVWLYIYIRTGFHDQISHVKVPIGFHYENQVKNRMGI